MLKIQNLEDHNIDQIIDQSNIINKRGKLSISNRYIDSDFIKAQMCSRKAYKKRRVIKTKRKWSYKEKEINFRHFS